MVIEGKEKVPMQVDGEAWLQDPGVIEVTHKNKARMIVKDKVSQDACRVGRREETVSGGSVCM